MRRRTALLASGAVVAAGSRAWALGEGTAAIPYEVEVTISAGDAPGEYVCEATLKVGESGRTHTGQGRFKRGDTGTVRTGEGRPDGSSVDLTVDVTFESAADQVVCRCTVRDREKVVYVQRTRVQLGRRAAQA